MAPPTRSWPTSRFSRRKYFPPTTFRLPDCPYKTDTFFFTISCVGPRVAAAAAKAALVFLANAADPLESSCVDAGCDHQSHGMPAAPALTTEQVLGASLAAVHAAAIHAKLLADRDQHEIEKLAVGVVEMQMRKIEMKLRQIEALDKGLCRERLAVARMFEKIATDRVVYEKHKHEAELRAKQVEDAAVAVAAAAAAQKAETERQ